MSIVVKLEPTFANASSILASIDTRIQNQIRSKKEVMATHTNAVLPVLVKYSYERLLNLVEAIHNFTRSYERLIKGIRYE